MKFFWGLFLKKGIRFWGIVTVVLVIGGLFYMLRSGSVEVRGTPGLEDVNPGLAIEVEDLNNVLPQRLAMNTYFDSVGIGPNQLYYYYSLTDLTQDDFQKRNLHDSLYTEAVERIPCTLWRPLYMQGVEVTFTYFSAEGEQLLQFAREQAGSCQ